MSKFAPDEINEILEAVAIRAEFFEKRYQKTANYLHHMEAKKFHQLRAKIRDAWTRGEM